MTRGATSTRLLLLLLACALAMPSGQAAEPWQTHLTAASAGVESTSGMQGELVALLYDDSVSGSDCVFSAGRTVMPFTLNAPSLKIEWDHANASAGVGSSTYVDPRTQHLSFTDATVDGVDAGCGSHFWVLATDQEAPNIRASSDCAPTTESTIAPPTKGGEVRRGVVKASRSPFEIPLSSAFQWTACSSGTALTIEGDFTVAIWERLARLEASGETLTLDSGRHDVAGQVGPMRTHYAGAADEYFLHVVGGKLTLRIDSAFTLYAREGELDASGGVVLRDAVGPLPGAAASHVDGQDVRVLGAVNVAIDSVGGGLLRADLSGQPELVEVDGVAVSTSIAVPSDGGPAFQAWLVAVMVLAVVGGAASAGPGFAYWLTQRFAHYQGSLAPRTRAQRRAVGLWVLARLVLPLGQGPGRLRMRLRDVGFWFARRSQRLFPAFGDAQLQNAICKAEALDWQGALQDYKQAYAKLARLEDRSTAAVGAAVCCVQLGRLEEAASWIGEIVRADWRCAVSILKGNQFDMLAGQPGFATWRYRALYYPHAAAHLGGVDVT